MFAVTSEMLIENILNVTDVCLKKKNEKNYLHGVSFHSTNWTNIFLQYKTVIGGMSTVYSTVIKDQITNVTIY